jgi:cell division inhibitor SulA/protein ImuA
MAAESGRSIAVYFRSTAAEHLSTPAHLRVVLHREEGVLKARIPKRRGPPLTTPVPLAVGRVRRMAASRARDAVAMPILVPERARPLQLVRR